MKTVGYVCAVFGIMLTAGGGIMTYSGALYRHSPEPSPDRDDIVARQVRFARVIAPFQWRWGPRVLAVGLPLLAVGVFLRAIG